MPLYYFHCRTCDKTSELLIRGSETAECPHCGATNLDQQIAKPATPGRSKEIIRSARAQAAREGHFSNYSRSERKR
jgi:putative FmdB family regulatory protein